jgi:hypothetical protein
VEKSEEASEHEIQWHVVMRPGTQWALPGTLERQILDAFELIKADLTARHTKSERKAGS